MLTLFLFLINICISITGIYIYDYQVDQSVNDPLVILLSILCGTILMILLALIYEEGFYYTVAKKKPLNSMLKHKIAKQMMSFPLYFMNYKITVEGKKNLPKDPGFSIYSNHTSMMDIPLLMQALYEYPVAFLAKKVVVKLPLIGKWTPALGCVSIDRTDARKGAEAIIQTIRNIKTGNTMVVFPEGTRTKVTGRLLPFKDGSFKVALKSKRPLVPVTIVKPKNFDNIKWPFRRNIKVVIHEALPYDEYRTKKSSDLSEHIKSIIEKAL